MRIARAGLGAFSYLSAEKVHLPLYRARHGGLLLRPDPQGCWRGMGVAIRSGLYVKPFVFFFWPVPSLPPFVSWSLPAF
jgi:hypothetical protein